jgi:Alanine dehydrogenase/PNT, N-terminal domain
MSKPVFWLRCEKKEFERRAALTPTTSKKLIDAGFEIFVERDEQRIFDDSEYEASVHFPTCWSHLNISTALGVSSSITIPGLPPQCPFPSLA